MRYDLLVTIPPSSLPPSFPALPHPTPPPAARKTMRCGNRSERPLKTEIVLVKIKVVSDTTRARHHYGIFWCFLRGIGPWGHSDATTRSRGTLWHNSVGAKGFRDPSCRLPDTQPAYGDSLSPYMVLEVLLHAQQTRCGRVPGTEPRGTRKSRPRAPAKGERRKRTVFGQRYYESLGST